MTIPLDTACLGALLTATNVNKGRRFNDWKGEGPVMQAERRA